MGIHELPPVTDADGKELSEDEQDAALDERKTLSFEYSREDGKVFKYAMIVDPARIDTGHLLEYQRATAQLTQDIEAKEAQIEAIEAAKVEAEKAAKNKSRKSKNDDPENDNLTGDELQVMVAFSELQNRLGDAEAALLVNGVESWNVRQNGAVAAPNAAFLRGRTGPGQSAHAALKAWFFPTSAASAAEIGATETASTSN